MASSAAGPGPRGLDGARRRRCLAPACSAPMLACRIRAYSGRPPCPTFPASGCCWAIPAGSGPELVARLLAASELDPRRRDRRDRRAAGAGARRRRSRASRSTSRRIDRLERQSTAPGPALLRGPPNRPGRGADRRGQRGRRRSYVLDTFRQALGLAQAGELDAICFAPCNKQAMHLGGLALRGRAALLRRCAWLQGLRRRDQCDRRARDHARHLARAAARGRRPDHRGRRAAGDPPRPRHAAGAPAIRIRGSGSPGSTRMPATAASSGARRSR